MKTFVKAGDEVVIIAGDHIGERGKVLQVLPRVNRLLVEGVNKMKKHERKSQDNPEGAIAEREAPLHISNVMRADRWEARLARRQTEDTETEE